MRHSDAAFPFDQRFGWVEPAALASAPAESATAPASADAMRRFSRRPVPTDRVAALVAASTILWPARAGDSIDSRGESATAAAISCAEAAPARAKSVVTSMLAAATDPTTSTPVLTHAACRLRHSPDDSLALVLLVRFVVVVHFRISL